MKKNLRKIISTVMAASLVLSSANAATYADAAKKVSITKTAKVTAGKSTVVKLKNNKKKVKWKVTKGTKYVKITKKSKTSCTVKGIKKGKATVQATVGKKKYKCTITVAAAKKAKATKKPSVTKKPSTTKTPMVTNTPEVTQSPVETEKPQPSGTPETTTVVPIATANVPIAPIIPQESKTPDTTIAPIIPHESKVPDTTIAPIIPQESKTPEVTPVPTEPQNSKAPDTTQTPTETPKVTPTPTITPEITETPKTTEVPTVTTEPSDIKTVIYDGTNSQDMWKLEQEGKPYKLVVKDGVKSIAGRGVDTFSGCSGLTGIEIPSSVESIGERAFDECSSLTSIKVDEKNTVYDSRENCNAIIEKESNKLVVGCKNTKIPSSVTSIGDYALAGCSGLTSIEIPNSVTSIGNDAFMWCNNLESITWNGTTYSSVDEFLEAFKAANQ